MRTLGLDFASHEGHLACIDGDRTVAMKMVQRINDAAFVPLLAALLVEAGWTPATIERIACNVGPGGFTSVRGGVVFANALADQLGLPIAGYHGSTLMMQRAAGNVVGARHAVPLQRHDEKIFWIHSTRADQVFIRGGPWTEPTMVPLAEAVAVVSSGVPIVGDLLEDHRSALAAVGASFPSLQPLSQALPAFLAGLSYARTSLVPWYGRGI